MSHTPPLTSAMTSAPLPSPTIGTKRRPEPTYFHARKASRTQEEVRSLQGPMSDTIPKQQQQQQQMLTSDPSQPVQPAQQPLWTSYPSQYAHASYLPQQDASGHWNNDVIIQEMVQGNSEYDGDIHMGESVDEESQTQYPSNQNPPSYLPGAPTHEPDPTAFPPPLVPMAGTAQHPKPTYYGIMPPPRHLWDTSYTGPHYPAPLYPSASGVAGGCGVEAAATAALSQEYGEKALGYSGGQGYDFGEAIAHPGYGSQAYGGQVHGGQGYARPSAHLSAHPPCYKPYGNDFCIIAEAAKKAEVACMVRDMGDFGL